MSVERIKDFIRKYPIVAYPAGAIIVFISWSILMSFNSMFGQKQAKNIPNTQEDIGISVGGGDQKAYMARLEKDYYDFEDRIARMEKQFKAWEKSTKEIKEKQKDINTTVQNLDKNLMNKLNEEIEQMRSDVNGSNGLAKANLSSMELAVADISPVNHQGDNVYLPIGSFCKGTLLTGVYATADQNNPLPVLIALDEAFFGPNKTRIPLKGSFVLGKAYGDLVSERALIQIIALSSVFPDGTSFEQEENLGYVTDVNGELGVHGQLIRNTGKQLAVSFMGGFLSGGSQALADQEVSRNNTVDGEVVSNVTGNTTKHALFSGLAKSAGDLSEYYSKQTENMIPAIHIQNGQSVYFIVQKGVRIHGLSRVDSTSSFFMD